MASMPAPTPRKRCVCGQLMTWFGDHWVCVGIKFHDKAVNKNHSGR